MYSALGFIFVALGFLGIFLPVLPTTPFVLLAAGCFAKSSPKWHAWLLQNRMFGPLIENWKKHHCIPLKSKIIALSMIVLFGGYSIGYALENIYLRIISSLILLFGIGFIIRTKTCAR